MARRIQKTSKKKEESRVFFTRRPCSDVPAWDIVDVILVFILFDSKDCRLLRLRQGIPFVGNQEGQKGRRPISAFSTRLFLVAVCCRRFWQVFPVPRMAGLSLMAWRVLRAETYGKHFVVREAEMASMASCSCRRAHRELPSLRIPFDVLYEDGFHRLHVLLRKCCRCAPAHLDIAFDAPEQAASRPTCR